MSLDEITQLVAHGESETVEFKTSTAQLKRAFETVCAFLNGDGGYILIGVNHKGDLVGQQITDKTKREIASELTRIEPTPEVHISYTPLEEEKNTFIILIQVSKDLGAPCLYDGRPYQRHQSSTIRMPQQRYEQLLMCRTPIHYSWETIPASGYCLHDFDKNEIHRTVLAGIRENRIPAVAHQEDTQTLLKRLRLFSEGTYTQAAVVLYARQESLRLLQCTLKMARFMGKDKLGDYIDNQQISGHIFFLLEEADAFLRRHLSIASFFKPDQWKRTDQPTLPVLAIREALINAFCHRDYSDEISNVTLAIFDDRVEIWNSGRLPPTLTIADLQKSHDSFPRNKLIAHVLYACGLIEAWGTGTNKMITLCKEAHIPRPLFKERSGGLLVIFRFRTPLGTSPLTRSNFLSLTKRQREIFTIIQQNNGANIHLIQSTLTSPPSQRIIQLDLKALERAGFIRLKGRAQLATWLPMKNTVNLDTFPQ